MESATDRTYVPSAPQPSRPSSGRASAGCEGGGLRESLRPQGWPIERQVSLLAGGFTLFSLAMGRVHHPRWRLMAGMIGANLVLQATVGWCPTSLALRKLGARTSAEIAREA